MILGIIMYWMSGVWYGRGVKGIESILEKYRQPVCMGLNV